ncbi:MAG: ribonuclease HI family protein [Deltaproteobacteria bacterium]|nr:ribonuclease HI family protein [Deltaproteobacteria bacterium]
MECLLYSDGAARGNPGPAGAGATILKADGTVVGEVCTYLGEMTNNQAEYRALLLALDKASTLGATQITIYADSELLVRQVKGEYRVRDAGLKPLFHDVMGRLQKLDGYTIQHIPREKNKRADQLANLAIDSQKL